MKIYFHPDIAKEQEKLDSETENPIDVSKVPPDTDHDS